MRVLIAVGETNRGGTETWLLHIARQLQGRCQLDFLVHTRVSGAYDQQLADAGARVIPCCHPHNPVAYGREFLKILRESGPYDVVHSHVQCYSAWILLLAWIGGVRTRIAHSHTDLLPIYRNAGLARKFYMTAMKALLRVVATRRLATSSAAAVSLFGKSPYQLHLSCVDLAPLARARDAAVVRSSLGIPADAIVVGHIGSFRPEKNHEFALRVAAELSKLSPRYYFLFKGEGVLKARIQDQAARLGIAGRCSFLPSDDDVPRVLRGAIDLFLFPSTVEGLGLATVEAQAAGLRCFVSDAVPPEAIVALDLVERLRLEDGPEAWAAAIHATAGNAPRLSPEEALDRAYRSGFDIARNADALLAVYEKRTATVSLQAKYRSGLVTTVVSGAVMFVSYRLYLRYLGYESYGLWLVLSTVLTIVQLGGVGLAPALTRLVAQSHPRAARYLGTSICLVLLFGLALSFAVLGSGSHLASAFRLSAATSRPFLALLPYVTALSVYAVVVDLFTATLSGLGRIDLANYAQLVSQCAGALTGIVMLYFGFGLVALLAGTIVSLIVLHAQLLFHIGRLSPDRRFEFHGADLRELLSFGGWVAATTLVNASIGPATRILLARFAGLSAVPAYDLALSACYKLRGVWECALRALLPEVSRLSGGSGQELKTIYSNAVRQLIAWATPVYAAVFVFATPILRLWLGSATATGAATLRVLLAATYVNLQAVPPYYLLMGMGQVWRCFAASAAMACISLTVALLAIRVSGTLTAPAASGGFLLGTLALTVYLSLRARKVLRAY